MVEIRELIGKIRKFSKDVIDVNDFYRIKNWTEDQFIEYIENYDLNKEVVDLFMEILEIIKRKVDNPNNKGCIDIQGNFGMGKSHILLFLAVILNKNEYKENIQNKIKEKLKEISDLSKKYREILDVLEKPKVGSDLKGTIVIPIRLLKYQKKDFAQI